ncbi:rhamnosyltransferase [Rhizobium sp. BK181]|uniref:glycosyltransferase family 2 protein n=1 Tax=Rhizobium sp. BK181 TaxID=2587072 RepID=UPI0017D866F4|nr:glycosyltransferase family 2 protein [Rhizobium sp. BK181]MBB3315511.1 rhamnosyltransferase [Rhizobium sp. BK181]
MLPTPDEMITPQGGMQSSSSPSKITGVIVSYNPDTNALRQLATAVAPQLDQLLVVDNGSCADVGLGDAMPADIIRLDNNYGIARAQNIGIEKARANGADYVLLLDQDSVPAPDMVATLLAAILVKEAEGSKVACAGPRYTDSRKLDAAPFVRLEGLRLKRQTCERPAAIIDVDFLIASGCLIPLSTIEAVGDMVEEMFIDYVDIEWGLRAKAKGYRSYGVCGAFMEHALGDESIAFGKRHVPVHSPLRHYYHVRNAIWLCRQPWLTKRWRVVLLWRVVCQFGFFSLMTAPRLQHAGMMTVGLFHGIINRMGKK